MFVGGLVLSDLCHIFDIMFEDLVLVGDEPVLARLGSALDELTGLDLSARSGEQVLGLLAGLEARVRRLAVVDQALVAEVDRRGFAAERGCRSTAVLLTGLSRVGHREAAGRAAAAARRAPRVALTGAPMPAEFERTAAAQAEGMISPAHARIVTTTIDRLPVDIRDEQFDDLEAFLVGQARQFPPRTLAGIARRLTETLAPDGHEPGYRDRIRHLTIHQRPDGSSSGSFELTAHATEALLTVLDATAAPRPSTADPEADGVKDPRTAGQRRYDGLLDALLLTLRSDQLPTCNGVSTTILLTLTTDQAATGVGLAQSGHGALIPVSEALRMAGGDARVFPVIFDKTRRVQAYGSAHRIFTEGQRLAMIARDQGCRFSRLHRTRAVDRSPPHHRLRARRQDQRRQRHPPVRIRPRQPRQIRLVVPDDQRNPALGVTHMDRPHPNTKEEPRSQPDPGQRCVAIGARLSTERARVRRPRVDAHGGHGYWGGSGHGCRAWSRGRVRR